MISKNITEGRSEQATVNKPDSNNLQQNHAITDIINIRRPNGQLICHTPVVHKFLK